MALLHLPVLDNPEGRTDAWPGIQRAEHAEQCEKSRHHQGEHFAPALVQVAHRRYVRDHQERLGSEISVSAVGQNGGFILDFAPIEIQPLFRRTEQLRIPLVDFVFRRGGRDDSRHVDTPGYVCLAHYSARPVSDRALCLLKIHWECACQPLVAQTDDPPQRWLRARFER
ncbi:hypothetical protein D3C80_1445410 [compost metagenome]